MHVSLLLEPLLLRANYRSLREQLMQDGFGDNEPPAFELSMKTVCVPNYLMNTKIFHIILIRDS